MEALEIQLTRGCVARIDAELFNAELSIALAGGGVWTGRISSLAWYAIPQGRTVYAKAVAKVDGRSRGFFLHRLILQAQQGQLVDHRDCNGLNCVRDNLRLTNPTGNSRNRQKKLGGRSRLKGAHPEYSKWRSVIRVDGRMVDLGTFSTEEEAGIAYDRAARGYFGEFARLNFPGLVTNASREELEAEDRARNDEKDTRRRERTAARNARPGKRDRFVEHDGLRLNMAQWGRRLGLTTERIRQRLNKFPVEVALRPRARRGELAEAVA